MQIQTIIKNININLAGEMLRYNDLEPFLDRVIDEINENLNSTYPSFSEFVTSDEVRGDANYNLFPDRFIRSVVVPGVCYYYYQSDEEGEPSANSFGGMYRQNLFKMTRDFIMKVPIEYQSNAEGYVEFAQELGFGIGIDITKRCKI